MAILPLISQESFNEIIDLEEPELQNNYEFILLEFGLEILSTYFGENGHFPATSRPKSNVPPRFHYEGKLVNSQEITQYFEKNNVSIY